MREMFVGTREEQGEDGRAVRCDYYILIDQMEVGGSFACESYGVGIAESDGERVDLPNITTSAARIDELMELLTRNAVTPASLRDVVEDWL
ncbi:DUF6514 family protein [Pseudoflavonifractor sp. CLA-AP-H29]|uniref:DUF6514 family protein n=1 Tax=Pseudoflavonifractor intestinihominis TaxID=3133171 RepID=A0ABV1E807_9FIRM